MKKTIKRILIAMIIILAVLIVFVAAWIFFIAPKVLQDDADAIGNETEIFQIAEKSEKIDINNSNGVMYVNNEIVVFIQTSAGVEEATALFSEFDANLDETMADIGVYKLIFKNSMTYDELEDTIEKLKTEEIVEDACLNTITLIEQDTKEDDFVYKESVYPNDSWNGSAWSVDAPGGENWGMEAIQAPGAWGYLEQLSTVKIGLIDSMPDASHEDIRLTNTSCLFIDEKTGMTQVNRYGVSADNHGTHVAGTMNAQWNNTLGVSGVAGGKGELFYSAVYYDNNGKVSTKYGTAYSYLLALKTLIEQDVQVINISQNTNRLIGFAASHGNNNAINYLSQQADFAERGLSRIVEARTRAGKPDFLICVAAGNSNSTYYYKDDKQLYGYREKMTAWENLKYLFGWRGEIGGSLAKYNNFLNLMDEDAVKNRVIVVGAIGIDEEHSTEDDVRYSYAYFSNEGDRIDIVAPGVDIYSCIPGTYGLLSGTSMAAPHVSGAAGLVFAANPKLSGPEVKQIICASSVGRYYHGNSYSGLLNVNMAVVNALKTVDTSVEKVLKTENSDGLDLCFIVDTTGSMEDDIDNAKANMEDILTHLENKTTNFRVALVDYRDFASRTGASKDYASKVQLEFTDNKRSITEAINHLTLGHGGDSEETVYSALMDAVGLQWRSDAKKVIIILGDAAPLEPEPITNYTYEDVFLALFNADIYLDYEASDERVFGDVEDCLINVFSIGTDASDDAEDFFKSIALDTGGSYAGVDDASKVSDAIIDSIEQIEVVKKVSANAGMGDSMANVPIDIYLDGKYLFTQTTDMQGDLKLEDLEPNTYRWISDGIKGGGIIEVGSENKKAVVKVTKTYWFTLLIEYCRQHMLLLGAIIVSYVTLCIAVPVFMKIIIGKRKR